MKQEKSFRCKALLSILCNLLIVILTCVNVSTFFHRVGDGNMQVVGTYCFQYFTVDSNILSALTALLLVCIQILVRKQDVLPQWAVLCKYVGTVTVALTFLTVVFFLSPTQGFLRMFYGNAFYLHLIGPLLALGSLFFLEKGERPITLKETLYCLAPIFVYACVYLTMVVIVGWENGGWFDFYGFNRGGRWYLSFVLMLIAGWALCMLLRWVYNRVQFGKKKQEETA